jgi:ABC-type phosphate transport system substrate-binding protein
MGGSSSISSLLNIAIEDYNRIFPESHLSYLTMGTEEALQALRDGRLQMAFSSQEVIQGESSLGLQTIPLAEDPIVLIGNRDLPVENLRTRDLKSYLLGEKLNSFWGDIKFVHRNEDSGTRTSLMRLLGVDEAQAFTPALIAYSNQEMIQKVILNPGSLGYISYSFAKEALRLGVKPISLDGLKPWLGTEELLDYPLARRLYLVLASTEELLTLQENRRRTLISFLTLLTWQDIQSQWENLGVLTIDLSSLEKVLSELKASQK